MAHAGLGVLVWPIHNVGTWWGEELREDCPWIKRCMICYMTVMTWPSSSRHYQAGLTITFTNILFFAQFCIKPSGLWLPLPLPWGCRGGGTKPSGWKCIRKFCFFHLPKSPNSLVPNPVQKRSKLIGSSSDSSTSIDQRLWQLMLLSLDLDLPLVTS